MRAKAGTRLRAKKNVAEGTLGQAPHHVLSILAHSMQCSDILSVWSSSRNHLVQGRLAHLFVSNTRKLTGENWLEWP